MKFKIVEGFDPEYINYYSRGWILSNGDLLSTSNAPHYEKEHLLKDPDSAIKYNFGYERYIGLPKNKPTREQYKTLLALLDYYFTSGNNVGERSRNLEIAGGMDSKGDFKSNRYNPQEYTPDDLIKIIKRFYNSGNLYENLENNLYHAYHGSRESFDRFKYEFIGSHALENGFGLYFTNNEDTAKSYGDYIIEADLLIRKPFSNEEITITKEQVKEYIRKYIDPIGDDYLSNYGWYEDEGYENVLNEAVDELFTYNECDNDIISEILPAIQNKYSDEAYDAIYEIFHKDGIIYKGYSEWDGELITNYIVYSNNQIKNKKKLYFNKET